ncbi:hypothetical protein DFH07DRAFT_770036 [Mycena maculata]|uniref:Uncharacterized protein n=1 Tax=Mycena maculata TaxID=230809 RepID=A0AAD7NM30_9AGAR|nr:hypothetical protein DFH07DRAFT_770036 [Mycena maculata]
MRYCCARGDLSETNQNKVYGNGSKEIRVLTIRPFRGLARGRVHHHPERVGWPSGNLQDLEAAMENTTENSQAAVVHTPEGHPDLVDLEAALEHVRPGNPELIGCLQDLGVFFNDRYQHSGHVQDIENALSNFAASFKSTT